MTAASTTTSAVRAITRRRADACGSPGRGAGCSGALALVGGRAASSGTPGEADTRAGVGTAVAGTGADSPGVPQ